MRRISSAETRHQSNTYLGIPVSNYDQQLEKMKNQDGFIAALDQSGGSTPKALSLYGVGADAWSNDEEMYAVVHKMRTRIMTSASFTGARILAAILFENTMDRDVEGQPTPDYLWSVKKVVPILKVDKGLADEANGVQLMKPMPDLGALLKKAKSKGIFGTKMRSVIKQANATGIKAVVDQQFEVGRRTGADHRAGSRYSLSEQSGSGRPVENGNHGCAR